MHGWEALKNQKVIVYLYLLIFPDYPYNMANTFREIETELSDGEKKGFPKSLEDSSHVSSVLSELEKAGFAIKEVKKVQGRPDRSYYDVDFSKLNKLNSDVFKDRVHLKEEIQNEVLEVIIRATRKEINTGNKKRILRKIISLKKFDYLTIFLFIRELITELSERTFKEEVNGIEATINKILLTFSFPVYQAALDDFILDILYEERKFPENLFGFK